MGGLAYVGLSLFGSSSNVARTSVKGELTVEKRLAEEVGVRFDGHRGLTADGNRRGVKIQVHSSSWRGGRTLVQQGHAGPCLCPRHDFVNGQWVRPLRTDVEMISAIFTTMTIAGHASRACYFRSGMDRKGLVSSI